MRTLLLPGFPKSQHILWVRAPDEAGFSGLLSELADPSWVNLADYEPAALSRPSSAGRTWPTTSWRYGRKREAASLDPTTGGIYVLRVGDDAYGFAGRASPTEEVGRIARLTIDAGLMGSNEPIWFFTQKHQSLLKTHQNWQSLDDFIKEKLSKVFDPARYLEVEDLQGLNLPFSIAIHVQAINDRAQPFALVKGFHRLLDVELDRAPLAFKEGADGRVL